MSDDKMRAEFEDWADKQCMSLTRINWKCGTISEYAYTATYDAWQVWQAGYQAGQKAEREAIFIEWEDGEILASEVERLRAELAQLRKDWCDDDEAIKQQALRVLDAAKVEGDSVNVPRMGALAEMMADELVKVRAELAAAKAASVVPVEVVSCDPDYEMTATVVLWSNADAQRFADWLRERIKDTRPPAT